MGPLPVALRPAWSGSSFLVYAGAFMVLGSLGVLLGTLGRMQGSTALVAWSAVVLAILVVLAVAASRNGRPVVAGLCAFVAVAVVAVVAGSLLDAVGLAGDVSLFDQDFELAPLLGEVAVLVAALYAARKFRFPLLLLAATVAEGCARARHRRRRLRHGQLARLGGAPARPRRARVDRRRCAATAVRGRSGSTWSLRS